MKSKEHDDSVLMEAFEAPNELMATMVRDYLESEGIDAVIRSDQIVWYDSIAKASRGYWGKVFVRSEDGERAKKLIQEFLELGQSSPEDNFDEEPEEK